MSSMNQSMMIILLAFAMQAHANDLSMHAKEPAQEPPMNQVEDPQEVTDKLTDKLVNKMIGTSAVLPTANKQAPLLSRHPVKKVYATKNAGAMSSLTPQSSLVPSRRQLPTLKTQSALLPSRRQWPTLKNKYDDSTKNSMLTRAGAAEVPADAPKVDITSNVFNLVKNIVGKGALSLPAGVAAIGGDPNLILPAATLVTIMGLISGYSFFSIGRQCGLQNVNTYNEAWKKSVGPESTWVVTAIALAYPLMGCLAYAIIIGDLFSAIAKSGLLGTMAETFSRQTWIVGLSAVSLYPLCCLKDLSALASTSILGTLAVAYTIVVMLLRLFDGTYLPGGIFHAALSVLPSFTTAGGSIISAFTTFLTSPQSFVLLAMCGTAFIAHPNAPLYYDAAGRDNSKFGKIVSIGFGGAILFNLLILAAGFLTFGSTAQGNIINSYASTDTLISIARFAYGVSVVFTFPIVFAGLKPLLRQFTSGLKMAEGLKEQLIVTVPLVAITLTALVVSNVGLINALVGSTCGSALIFILPALMYLTTDIKSPMEKAGNYGLVGLGAVVSGLGLWKTLR
eukprot:gnl/MRDRNA2_/MRDRNA2_34556_c0_seq1.p1 gnl/MRDRNA2_/MRDRNA2_34556_c0~~gnl/MRDRNA2_/MRDRNA2_34556_c0_seq1.p1  ORF type:complete len:564 (+),score=67.45 gnl/MRDRNA2_/MRDRNA2_34556_c0_seq1:60-1751(+)